MFARQEIETGLAHAGAEALGIVEELGAQIIALLGQINGLDRGGNDGWRQGIGEEIGPRALAHEIDDGFGCGDITAGRAAQGLAQGACEDINLDPGAGGRSPALWADEAGGVAVIDQDEGIIGVRQFPDFAELGEIAIHGKHAVGDDHDAALGLIPREPQLGLQIRHIAVGIAIAGRPAQAHAINNRGMVQGVGNYGILLAEKRLEHAAIGIKTGGVENGIFHLHIAGDAGFQLCMKIARCRR